LKENAPLRETRYPYRGYGLPLPWADDYDKIPVERIVLGKSDLAGTVVRFPPSTGRVTSSTGFSLTFGGWTTNARPYY
jgi:hypothetical protein